MKQISRILNSSDKHWVGDAFYVSSVFSYSTPGLSLSPFLLMDYAAPHPFEALEHRRGVGAHPHKGFETVTIAYQGEVEHRDSSGGGGIIGPGDVQWMTAGSGVLHDEMHSEGFARSGGTFEMVQLWVNLPAKFKTETPHYQALKAEGIPTVALANAAGSLRVIAGQFSETRGAANTYTPIDLWDITAKAGKPITLPVKVGHNTALLVLSGHITVGETPVQAGQLAVVSESLAEVNVQSDGDSRVLYLGGEPINEPVVGYGPFVMNTEQEIQEAFKDFRSGKMGKL